MLQTLDLWTFGCCKLGPLDILDTFGAWTFGPLDTLTFGYVGYLRRSDLWTFGYFDLWTFGYFGCCKLGACIQLWAF